MRHVICGITLPHSFLFTVHLGPDYFHEQSGRKPYFGPYSTKFGPHSSTNSVPLLRTEVDVRFSDNSVHIKLDVSKASDLILAENHNHVLYAPCD